MKLNVSKIAKTLEKKHEFRLSRRSKHQMINFELRFQHKQRDYQLIIKTTINRDFVVAIRRYRNMIAIKSNDVTKMTKMTVSRDD